MDLKKWFRDRVAIVMGAASGIGLAVVTVFGREGARVVLADLHGDKAESVAAEVGSVGVPEVWGMICDVSEVTQVDACVMVMIDRFGRLDVVVNNAGLVVFKLLEEHIIDDWLKVLRVDLLGLFFFTRVVFRIMKSGSVIVNVSSVHVLVMTSLVAFYVAAKAALLFFTRFVSIEGKSRGIRVNAVLPGVIDMLMLWDNLNICSGGEMIDPSDVGKPEEVVVVILFLVLDEVLFV